MDKKEQTLYLNKIWTKWIKSSLQSIKLCNSFHIRKEWMMGSKLVCAQLKRKNNGQTISVFIKHVLVCVEKQRKVEKNKTLSDMYNYL